MQLTAHMSSDNEALIEVEPLRNMGTRQRREAPKELGDRYLRYNLHQSHSRRLYAHSRCSVQPQGSDSRRSFWKHFVVGYSGKRKKPPVLRMSSNLIGGRKEVAHDTHGDQCLIEPDSQR